MAYRRGGTSRGSGDGFNRDRDGFVNVYTDGACINNGRSSAKAGVGVYFEENHPLNVSAPAVGRQTNNVAEIQAVTEAARQAQRAGVSKLRINTDSDYLIKSSTEWMPNWKQNGWINSSGNPVVNRPEFQEMEQALAPLEVDWRHVPSHQGHHGNEMADRLAKGGARGGY